MSPPEIRPTSEEPAAESHSKSNQSLQPRESRNRKEQQGWITQTEWTIYIQDNSDDDRRSPFVVSIFRVPSFLKNLKREAYVPEIVSLGPYHHRRAELPPMGTHKGRAVRLMKKRFNESKKKRKLAIDPDNIDFCDRAREEIVKLENQIRDNYEEKLDCDGNTLALMLTLDGCFLLEILRTLGGDRLRNTSKYYDPIFGERKIDFAGIAILNDIVMLENQIPLSVLQKLLELEFNSVDDVKKNILSMLYPLVYLYLQEKAIDFKQWSWPEEQVHHLLGLLHSFILSPHSNQSEPADGIDHINGSSLWSKCIESSCVWSNLVKGRSSWRQYIKFRSGWCSPLQCFSRNRTVNNVKRIRRAIELRKAGIKFKRCNQGIKMIKFDPKNATVFLPRITVNDLTELFFIDGIDHINCSSSWSKCIESSCVWSNLVKFRNLWRKYIKFRSGWCSSLQCFSGNRTVNNVRRIRRAIALRKFKRCNQGIKMIKFDPKNATFFLPGITVTDRTEVLFPNLIAFEMCKPSQINYITCYVSLMDELVDSEEDVAVLRKSDIVTNYLGSDAQVAKLFNGLFKNVTESATDAFKDLKGGVHEHYRNEMKVQLAELVKEHLSSPWRTVALAAAILILLLTTVQTIFSVLSVYN